MAATAIEPPTVLGRATENFTKPIVVSTRKRARSTASRMGMASQEKLEKRRRELSMEVTRCVRREPAGDGRVLKPCPKSKDQTT